MTENQHSDKSLEDFVIEASALWERHFADDLMIACTYMAMADETANDIRTPDHVQEVIMHSAVASNYLRLADFKKQWKKETDHEKTALRLDDMRAKAAALSEDQVNDLIEKFKDGHASPTPPKPRGVKSNEPNIRDQKF